MDAMANRKEAPVHKGPIPPSPPKIFSSERTIEKRTADSLTTTPSRLRASKRTNDGSDEPNPFNSPTPSAPAAFKARLGLTTPHTTEAVIKTNPLSKLHFKKKGHPRNSMSEATSRQAGQNAPDLPGPTPPSGTRDGTEHDQVSTPTTEVSNTEGEMHAKADEDHDMDANHSHAPTITSKLGDSTTSDDDVVSEDSANPAEVNDANVAPEYAYPLPTPTGGYPEVHGIYQSRALSIATPETLIRWSKDKIAGGDPAEVFAWVANYCGKVDKELAHVTLAATLSTILGRGIIPDALSAISKPPPKSGDIWPFHISDLHLNEVIHLTTRFAWIFKNIQFFVVPSPIPPPTYVATLVKSIAFNEDAAIDSNWVAGLATKVKGKTDAKFYLNKVLDTLRIRRFSLTDSGHKTTFYYNIHVDFPMNLHEKFDTWKDLFEHFNADGSKPAYFDLEILGKVEVLRRRFTCLVCKGLDHPTAECKYPSIPGWPKPVPKPAKRQAEVSARNDRGSRGGRAFHRGGGRGRRGRGA
ncbi:hypothetical protein M422DRAFT_239313 [Sphaerobolus stellatus SS14]|nr:hypothetical protein M422DRAFT_239313 [Sphaerobolus stellatus SS14]